MTTLKKSIGISKTTFSLSTSISGPIEFKPETMSNIIAWRVTKGFCGIVDIVLKGEGAPPSNLWLNADYNFEWDEQ